MKGKEKELELSILEEMMSEMEDYEFDKKVKPKMAVIKVEKSEDSDSPTSLKELFSGKSKESEMDSMYPDSEDEEEDDELGARFKRLMGKK